MEVISGKIKTAKKVVIYGTEGIGKSSFASHFPNPIFIDTEGSTNELDVNRLPKPTSWQMLKSQIDYVLQKKAWSTLIIDTIDWAEKMCIESICAQHNKTGIEDFGYGNGYTYEAEEFGRFLNRLEDVISAGINVVLTAHAVIRKFEQPNEMGAYDRYELKLGKKTTNQISPMVKEWADMVLFANYKTYAVQVDDKGKKHKAQGGQRVMYTTHHPCWDAKNRYDLADELPFDYSQIAHIIPGEIINQQTIANNESHAATYPANVPKIPPYQPADDFEEIPEEDEKPAAGMYDNIPTPLADLMKANNVTPEEIQCVVAQRGYYPISTPIDKYSDEFISGCLIGAWEIVFAEIKKSREVPFN